MATKETVENKAGVPPHDLDLEKSVLGALLIDEDAIVKVVEFLKPEHFYRKAHHDIYLAILELYEKREPADLVTVPGHLKKGKKLDDIGGVSYLTELVNYVHTSSNIEFYAKEIKDYAVRRQLMSAASRIGDLSLENSDVEDVLDQAEQLLFSVSQDSVHQDFVPVKDTLEITFERLDELSKTKGAIRGVPTGFKSLDKLLSGLQKENLIILAARPSMGKSSLAINIGQYAASTKKKGVAIFSLEMGRESIVDRMISAQGDIDNWRISTGNLEEEDYEKFYDAPGTVNDNDGTVGILGVSLGF